MILNQYATVIKRQTNKQTQSNTKFSIFFFFFFFNCYLADPRPTLGHSQGDSLTNPMLIAAFYLIRPEGQGALISIQD